MSEELRIIDENLNRLSEGLRVLEDIARMLLNNAEITQQLKTLRHNLISADISFNKQLIQSRDSEKDVGARTVVAGEETNRSLADLLVANSKRTQESLRVLEEMAKLPALNLDSNNYKNARFEVYTVERNLLSKLLRQDKIKKLTGLYVVLDTEVLQKRDPVKTAQPVIRGGAKAIQLRDKISDKKHLLWLAQKLKEICAENDVLFIVNDYPDIALVSDADGLHVGQDDLPVTAARKIMPIDKIIGCSVASLDQAISAAADGADYLGAGSIFATASKNSVDICGLNVLRQITQEIKIPVVAIGGINKGNIAEVMDAGAKSAAVISAVLQATDPESAARELAGMMKNE